MVNVIADEAARRTTAIRIVASEDDSVLLSKTFAEPTTFHSDKLQYVKVYIDIKYGDEFNNYEIAPVLIDGKSMSTFYINETLKFQGDKTMKNKMKHIFRSLVAGVLAMSVFSLASCSFQEVKQNAVDNVVSGAEVVKDKIGISLMSTEYIQLASEEAVDEDYSKYPAQKLTATVLPATVDASEKLVDWSVDWIENKTGDETAAASDYIKLVPTADGSTECTVVCVKAFLGSSIGVKVTTRVGGYTALCTVTFIGTPTYLEFFSYNADGSTTRIQEELTSVPANASTSVYMHLYNIFETVGDSFGKFEIVKTGTTGTAKFQSGRYTSSGWVSSTIADRVLDFSSHVDKVAIENDNLVIVAGDVIESYDVISSADHRRTVYVSGAENVRFYVTVRDTVSGLQKTLYFTIYSTIDSVTLGVTNMSF